MSDSFKTIDVLVRLMQDQQLEISQLRSALGYAVLGEHAAKRGPNGTFDRTAYMRDYMRKRRREQKEGKK